MAFFICTRRQTPTVPTDFIQCEGIDAGDSGSGGLPLSPQKDGTGRPNENIIDAKVSGLRDFLSYKAPSSSMRNSLGKLMQGKSLRGRTKRRSLPHMTDLSNLTQNPRSTVSSKVLRRSHDNIPSRLSSILIPHGQTK